MNDMRMRFQIAAAYRWAYDNGEPMAAGLRPNSLLVTDLVARAERGTAARWAMDDAERAAALAHDHDQYLEVCMRQVTANLRVFSARQIKHPAAELEELQEQLGIRATPAEAAE